MKFLYYIIPIFLISSVASASWFTVQDLYLEGNTFTGRGNDAIHSTIGRQMDKSMSLGLNIDFFQVMFFSNKVEGRSGCINGNSCQFDAISYAFTTGMHVLPWLDLNYRHISAHALDNNYPYDVEDSIGFRIYLINSNRFDTIIP